MEVRSAFFFHGRFSDYESTLEMIGELVTLRSLSLTLILTPILRVAKGISCYKAREYFSHIKFCRCLHAKQTLQWEGVKTFPIKIGHNRE